MKQWDIQRGVFQTLTANTPLVTLVSGRIFDHIPQGTAYPYINIGEDTSLEWDTDTTRGSEATLTIHAWSRQAGRREVKQIMERVYDALHRQDIVIEGAHTVLCLWEFAESLLDPDGVTRHGIQRFRIIVQEA